MIKTYEKIKDLLRPLGFTIEDSLEINFGCQFLVRKNSSSGLIRIYKGKKGIRLDLSQLKDQSFKQEIEKILENENLLSSSREKKIQISESETKAKDIIGVDESGKGDYFGPLVTAAVFVNEEQSDYLKKEGIQDSKKLIDAKIYELAAIIKKKCPFSLVLISNEKYNELYDKMKNLNKMLAWAHARAIENVLAKTDCQTVLSDQFGHKELIQSVLMEKGRQINLLQRPKAETNTAVAAASILARQGFVFHLNKMEREYKIAFPKGASLKVNEAAKNFIKTYGQEDLKKVAKLHFSITNKLQ